ncbi:MAG TPA: PKD domain-containing protein [Gemmatimonadaceae bacterium]|nr:PKD domain-containing protein [Gemmatimonadaceae bacterium]
MFSCSDDFTAPHQLPSPHTVNFDEVVPAVAPQTDAGGYHNCAVKNNGSVLCWGYNEYGEINVPADLGSVSQISAGAFHNCALTTSGEVRCWGYNLFGQSTPPADLGAVSQISAGNYHTCALKTDGTVACWGSEGGLQIFVPAGLNSVTQLSAGIYHSCALKSDGTVTCWGYDAYDENTLPSDINDVVQVSVGYALTCVLRRSGTVYCRGDNDAGQATVPADLGSVSQISAGEFHVCALTTAGTVVCWGNNDFGQATVPAGLSSVTSVSAGTYHTCAQKTDGTIVCWGNNNQGQTVTTGIDLTPDPQSISFTSIPPEPAVVGSSYTVAATGGESGNPVIFSIPITTSVCTIEGDVVTFVAAGSCVIAADQAGGGGYPAAPQMTQIISVDTRPVANAGSAQSGAEGSAVTFSAAGSTDPDGDQITSYTWNFGDGTSQTVSTQSVQHVYDDNGSYAVLLTVTDSRGATSSAASTSANIANISPTATFAPTSPSPEGPLTLSLSSVHDAAGDLATLQYSFDCGDGRGFSPFAASSSIECYAPDNGTLSVRAQLKDKDGAVNQYAASISLVNVAPTVTIISAPSSGLAGVDYTIQYRFNDAGTRDSPWYYQPNWGDGKKLALYSTSTQGQTITQTHRYTSRGTYTVTLKIIDKDGSSGSTSLQLTIR